MNVLMKNCLYAMPLLLAASLSCAADCTVNASSANFGDYNTMVNNPNRSGIATISVFCSSTVPAGNETVNYTLMLSPGLSGNNTRRSMFSGANGLGYNLYSDAALTQIWGDGAGGSTVVTGSMMLTQGRGSVTAMHTVYGAMPSGQNASSGQFSDTLSVTLIY